MSNIKMTFPEMQEWFDENGGQEFINAQDWSGWGKAFKNFCEENGYSQGTYAPNIFIKKGSSPLVEFQSSPLPPNTGNTNATITSNYGSYHGKPSWSTGSATSGSITGTLTGGSAKVGQQLLETKVNPTTGKVTTASVGGTIIGTMGLGDLLLGSALGVGLGVSFTDFFPDQATDFSNFMLSPLIKAGILEPATYEDTRVGLVSVLREHNEEGTEKKLITPYAPYELVEKGLQYLLKIGAFQSNIDITLNKVPKTGATIVYTEMTWDIVKEMGYICVDNCANYSVIHTREECDKVINSLRSKYDIDFSNKMVGIRWSANSGPYDTLMDLTINLVDPKLKVYNNIRINRPNNLPYYDIFTGTDKEIESFYISSNPKRPEKYPWTIGHDEPTATKNTTYIVTGNKYGKNEGDLYDSKLWFCNMDLNISTTPETVKGLQFTDYTQLIKSVEDITTQLEAWKKKNGFKISTPQYDENGNPVGEREQWYLPLPTPNPSSKTSPDYTLPTGVYEPTNIPDNDPALQDEVTNRNNDYSQELPSNPSYDPTPTPPSEDTGKIETPSSILGNNGSGLWSVYNPTIEQLNSFGAWLWSSDIWDQIKQFFSDPMQGIIGLHKIFCKPTNGETKTIIAGYLDSKVNSLTVTKQYERIDCGSLACSEYYGNALDYSPYTNVSIYLPFIGVVDLNVNEIMGSILHVFYDVDILTGACLAAIEIKDSNNTVVSLYQYNGICSVQIPLTSGNYGSVIASLVTTGAGIVATVASGGALAPVLLSGAVSTISSGTNVKQSGSIGANIGAMAQKKPYLIISRKIPHMALNYNTLEGFPSNNRVYLSEIAGYVRCKDVFIASNNCNQLEKEMIEEELKNGVFIKG